MFARLHFPLRWVAACLGAWLLAATAAPHVAMAQSGAMASLDMSGLAKTPPMTLAQSAPRQGRDLDLRQWWVSEKYDGIRAWWDGQRLISRQGHTIDAPTWFTQGLGQQVLEGELWAGRERFACVQSAVGRGSDADALWRGIRWMVFDAPGASGDFAQRQRVIRQAVEQAASPWIEAAPQWQVATHAQLQKQLHAIVAEGGEGLMLRRADAPYRSGRNTDLLKLKLLDDSDGRVIAHLPGKGRLADKTGALLLELADGKQLRLGTGLSDAQRTNPPPIGTVVRFHHNGWHAGSGLPRFARFWRVRDDADGAFAPKSLAASQPVAAECLPPTK